MRLLAQHQWVSSAVLEERELEPGALTVRTTKAIGRELGTEAYTVALAGSSRCRSPGRGRAHRHGRGEALARALRRAAAHARRPGRLPREPRAAPTASGSRSGRAARARSRPTRAGCPGGAEAHGTSGARRRTRAATRQSSVHGHHRRRLDSLSWRCTRPLRGVKALARRRETRRLSALRRPAPAMRRGWRSLEHRERVDVRDLRRAPQHRVLRDAVAAHDLGHRHAAPAAVRHAAPQVVVLPAVQPRVGGVPAERAQRTGAHQRHRVDVVHRAQPLGIPAA